VCFTGGKVDDFYNSIFHVDSYYTPDLFTRWFDMLREGMSNDGRYHNNAAQKSNVTCYPSVYTKATQKSDTYHAPHTSVDIDNR